MSNSTSFKVHDVEGKKFSDCVSKPIWGRSSQSPDPDLIKQLPHYGKNNCTAVLQMSVFTSGSTPTEMTFSRNGLIDTIVEAYNYHSNLVLRPDDIWAAIMTQFSYYINKHSVQFREKLFGKKSAEAAKKIEIHLPESDSKSNAGYQKYSQEITNQIQKLIADPDLKDWIIPNFSTTSDIDVVTTGLVFMATNNEYFEYEMKLNCGIPSITLEGTVDDWKNILERLEKLWVFRLDKWYKMLHPIIGQFVKAKEGNVDLEFWQKIVECHSTCGPYEVTGWITAFCVFDNEGNYQQSFDHWGSDDNSWLFIENFRMATGVVEVDAKKSGSDDNYVILAGHLATEVKNDGYSVQPALGWAVALKPDIQGAGE